MQNCEILFRFPADQTTQLELCTRFIALAGVGNVKKEKYIYALSLTPVEKMRVMDLIQKTTNEIMSPFEKMNFQLKDANVSYLPLKKTHKFLRTQYYTET